MQSVRDVTVYDLALQAGYDGFSVVLHGEDGEPYDQEGLSANPNFEYAQCENAMGLSLKLGPNDKLVALRVKNAIDNAFYRKLGRLHTSYDTCRIIEGCSVWLIYRSTSSCFTSEMSNIVGQLPGVTLHTSGRAPYFGLQANEWEICKGDIINEGRFIELDVRSLRSVSAGPERVPKHGKRRAVSLRKRQVTTTTLPVSSPTISHHRLRVTNYSYGPAMLSCDKMTEVNIMVYMAFMRYRFAHIPDSYITDVELYRQLSEKVLSNGVFMVKLLMELTYHCRNVKPSLERGKFDEYCNEYYTNNPERRLPSDSTSLGLINYIDTISNESQYGEQYKQSILDLENRQLDPDRTYTVESYIRSLGSDRFAHLSLEAVVVAIIEEMRRFARYVPMSNTFVFQGYEKSVVHIVKDATSKFAHIGVRYQRGYKKVRVENSSPKVLNPTFTDGVTKEGPPEYTTIPTYDTVNPFDVYRMFHYGTVDAAFPVPYSRRESAHSAIVEHTAEEKISGIYLNTFAGFEARIAESNSMSAMATYLDRILNHIKVVYARRDEKLYRWLVGRLALMIRKPRRRSGTTIVLYGKQGCGKTCFLEFLIHNVFGSNIATVVTGLSKLTQRFNSRAEGQCLIVVNEMADADEKGKGRNQQEILKALISDRDFTVERKGQDPYTVPNFANFIITTNNETSIVVKRGDRRYVMIECSDEYIATTDHVSNRTEQQRVNQLQKSTLYFTLLRESFSTPGVADAFYTYLLDHVPEEWLLMAENVYETNLRDRVMKYFDNHGYRYHASLVNGEAALPKSSLIISRGEIYIGTSNLYDNYVRWCKTQNMHPYTSHKLGMEFPIDSVAIRLPKRAPERLRLLTPDIHYFDDTSTSSAIGDMEVSTIGDLINLVGC